MEQAWAASKRGPIGDPIAELADRLGSDLDRGATRAFGGDCSIANGSSIALLFEYGGTSLLLTGDAYAGDLEHSIRRLLVERGLTQLEVELFKLAHHGSMANVTADLLGVIDPGTILVCTDGTRFGHPDHETIDLVRQHYVTTPIQSPENCGDIGRIPPYPGRSPPTQPRWAPLPDWAGFFIPRVAATDRRRAARSLPS